MDLTTLEGADTPGKVVGAVREGDAARSRPIASIPSVAAVCVYPNLVAVAKAKLAGSSVKVASVATAFPSGQSPTRRQARRRARRGRARGRRDRHGDRPRRLPLRPLREGRRRDRPGQGGVRRRAPEGDPRDRRARHLRQRPPRVAPRDRRRRRLHQDLDRQGEPRRDAPGDALHARGDPRRPRRDRAHHRHEARRRDPHREAGDPVPLRPQRDAGLGLDDARISSASAPRRSSTTC